jgi:hypothetical protein
MDELTAKYTGEYIDSRPMKATARGNLKIHREKVNGTDKTL